MMQWVSSEPAHSHVTRFQCITATKGAQLTLCIVQNIPASINLQL